MVPVYGEPLVPHDEINKVVLVVAAEEGAAEEVVTENAGFWFTKPQAEGAAAIMAAVTDSSRRNVIVDLFLGVF